MKLWAKTIGLNQILLITLTTLLVNQFFGNFPVNLPTLVRGIHFVETPLTNLLATAIPTTIYYNRAKIAFPAAQRTKRPTSKIERALFPLIIACSILLLRSEFYFRQQTVPFVLLTTAFGAITEIYFWSKPSTAALVPMSAIISMQLCGITSPVLIIPQS